MSEFQEGLELRRKALMAEIYEAFADVDREGGISWSGAEELDDYQPLEVALAAAERDTDRNWRDLIDDPNWDPDVGVGGWNFLDPIGRRYYLPAAMIRSVRSGDAWLLRDALTLPGYESGYTDPKSKERFLYKWSALCSRQVRCVRSFIEYMSDLTFDQNDNAWFDWQATIISYWAEA